MKITFLIPPALKGKAPERIFGCNYGLFYQPNIFILYLAAMLEKNGHKVIVLDCPVEKINWKKLKEYLKNDYSNFYVFYTVFLSEEIDKTAAKLIREVRGKVPIVFVGPEPTSRPESFILDKNCFVMRGEAEYTIIDFIDAFLGKKKFDEVLGLTFMENNKIINNKFRPLIKNLNIIPFPARHLIKRELYYNPKLKGRPSTVMLTSRNCFGRCIYCIPCSYMFAREIEYKRFFNCKPPVRVRSPKNIYEEFKLLKKQGYKAVAIIDDNFMGLKGQEERIIKICKLIKPLKMEWGCLARADQLNEDVVKAMADAGCVYVDIGAESFDQKVLDFVHKDLKVGDVLNAIFLLKKYGIEPKLNILFGTSPYETEESIKWTVKMLKELNIEWVSFDVTIPHPNTEFYKIVKNNKWFATKSKDFEPVDVIRDATVDFPNLNHEKLRELVKWSYREYYLRPQYIWKRLSKVKSFQDFKELVQTAWRLFF
ncbi:MAG: radical SAM protein [Candidatus Aenigmatarchaeota archaeon]